VKISFRDLVFCACGEAMRAPAVAGDDKPRRFGLPAFGEVVGCDYGLVCGFILVCWCDNEVVAIWAAEDSFGDALQVEIAGGFLSA
jgi:hypothetical protein